MLVNPTPVTIDLQEKRMRLSTIDGSVPFFTDLPLGKSALAEALGVSRNTVKSWHKLAYLLVAPYREQFPLVAESFPPTRNQEIPFSCYQCWVVSRVGWVMKVYRKSDFAKAYIASNQHLFSVAKFQSQIRGVA